MSRYLPDRPPMCEMLGSRDALVYKVEKVPAHVEPGRNILMF